MPVKDKSDSDKESDNSQESDDKLAFIKDDKRQQRLLRPAGRANNLSQNAVCGCVRAARSSLCARATSLDKLARASCT
jgi:hypothetical protein